MPFKPENPRQQTKSADPFTHLNDLGAFDLSGGRNKPVSPEKKPDNKGSSSSNNPKLQRSTGSNTRAKTSNIRPDDEMRDYINRINFEPADDEIDDITAAGRVDPDPDIETLPSTEVRTPNLPKILNQQLRAAGQQMPEWHTINNLPGYMARAIRSMGRQFFGMITRTPLEEIMTIANVQGQGPNTDDEMRAVGGWLLRNGEDLGVIHADFGMAIPGYEPEVKEYRAMGIRFHVVRDPMGQYIYAYPDADAKVPGDAPSQLNKPTPRALTNRESINMKRSNLIFEGIFQADLARDAILEEQFFKKSTAKLISEMVLSEASTLDSLIGGSPGGKDLISWLHKRDRLSSTATYDEVVQNSRNSRVQWMGFKSNPDHFMIIMCRNIVVGIKPPDQSYYSKKAADAASKGKAYNPERDNTMYYNVVGFNANQRVDNLLIPLPAREDFVDDELTPEEQKAAYMAAVADVNKQRKMTLNPNAPPTQISGKRGGKPFQAETGLENLLDRIKTVGGGINAIYVTTGKGPSSTFASADDKRKSAEFKKSFTPGQVQDGPEMWPRGRGIERNKINARTPAEQGKANFWDEFELLVRKLRPIIPKLIKDAEIIINRRMQRLQGADNFDAEEQLLSIRRTLNDFKIATNSAGEGPISKTTTNPIVKIIGQAVSETCSAPTIISQDGADYIRDLLGKGAAGFGPLLDSIRKRLIRAASQ